MPKNSNWSWMAVCFVMLMGVAVSVKAQAPPQFKADMLMSGPGGMNMQGKLYFSGGKMRMEMGMGGRNSIMIMDPVKKVAYMVMPEEEMYMEMNANAPGPMKPPKVDAMDPANPCGSAGVTACKKLGTETVNGYASEKWEFTQERQKITAWIATKLRLPIKTTGTDGSTMEFRNIVEGAQPANLFVVPADYEKMDMGGMGGMMGGMGGGGMSGMGGMAGMGDASDQDEAEDDADEDTEATKDWDGTIAEPASIWEEGKGWVMNITITAKGAKKGSDQDFVTNETLTVKYTASFPLNAGMPGVPEMAGPTWMTSPVQVIKGSPEAWAKPVTYTAEWEYQRITKTNTGCDKNDLHGIRPGNTTRTIITKGKTESKGSLSAVPADLDIGGNLVISSDLDSFQFMAVARTNKAGSEQTTEKMEDHCDAKNNTNENSTGEGNVSMGQIDIEDLPLPASRTAITGTKTMPWPADTSRFDIDMEATVQWNITPI